MTAIIARTIDIVPFICFRLKFLFYCGAHCERIPYYYMCHRRAHSRYVYLGANAKDTTKWAIRNTWKTFEAFESTDTIQMSK